MANLIAWLFVIFLVMIIAMLIAVILIVLIPEVLEAFVDIKEKWRELRGKDKVE